MTIRDIVLLLRRLWWVVLAAVVLGGGVAGLALAISAPQYQSTAQLLVAPPNLDTGSMIPPEGIATPQRAVNYASMATSAIVAQRVVDSLKLDELPAVLLRSVTAEVVMNSTIIEIDVVDTDPARAQQIAESFTAELIAVVPKVETASGPVDAIIVTDPADLPQLPHSAGKASILALGVLAGFVVGIAAIWLIQFMDVRVRRPDQLADLVGAPVLASAGAIRPAGEGGAPALARGAAAEPSRAIRTALDLGAPNQRPAVIAVCGVERNAVEVAANLAAAYTSAGIRAVLIDAAFQSAPGSGRWASPGDKPGLGAKPGLAEVLAGAAPLDAAITQWSDATLPVLSPGAPQSDPAALLRPDALTGLLDSARAAYDVVIIATSGITEDSAAAQLAAAADAALLVARWGRTRLGSIGAAADTLRTVHATVAGTVLSEVPGFALAQLRDSRTRASATGASPA